MVAQRNYRNAQQEVTSCVSFEENLLPTQAWNYLLEYQIWTRPNVLHFPEIFKSKWYIRCNSNLRLEVIRVLLAARMRPLWNLFFCIGVILKDFAPPVTLIIKCGGVIFHCSISNFCRLSTVLNPSFSPLQYPTQTYYIKFYLLI